MQEPGPRRSAADMQPQILLEQSCNFRSSLLDGFCFFRRQPEIGGIADRLALRRAHFLDLVLDVAHCARHFCRIIPRGHVPANVPRVI